MDYPPIMSMLRGMAHAAIVFTQTPLKVRSLARIVISFLTKENVDDKFHITDQGLETLPE